MPVQNRKLLPYFGKNLLTIVGIVLIWRGVWTLLDAVDKWFFGGNNIITAAGGIVLGFVLLYFPDRDLKEIEKL